MVSQLTHNPLYLTSLLYNVNTAANSTRNNSLSVLVLTDQRTLNGLIDHGAMKAVNSEHNSTDSLHKYFLSLHPFPSYQYHWRRHPR